MQIFKKFLKLFKQIKEIIFKEIIIISQRIFLNFKKYFNT